jgi:hypothetical protein
MMKDKKLVIHIEVTKGETSKVKIEGEIKNGDQELILRSIRDLTEKLLKEGFFKGRNKAKQALAMVTKLTKWFFEGQTTKLVAFLTEALKFLRQIRRR